MYIVGLSGSLDTETHEVFEEKVNPLLTESTDAIIFDMKQLNYISSIGISGIFSVRKYMENNNKHVFIVYIQPQIKKIFDLVKGIPHEDILNIKDVDKYLDKIQRNVLDQERGTTSS